MWQNSKTPILLQKSIFLPKSKVEEKLEIAAEANVEIEGPREASDELDKPSMTEISKGKSSKKSIFDVFNTAVKSRFDKFQNQKEKKGSKHFEKKVKTSFGNSDYPFLYTLA